MNLITFDVNEPLLKKKDKDLLTKKPNFFIGDRCLKQENIYFILYNKNCYLPIVQLSFVLFVCLQVGIIEESISYPDPTN